MNGSQMLVDPVELPEWLRPLATNLTDADASEFSRLLPPVGVPVVESAVLVLFSDGTGEGPDVLIIQRAAELRFHAGQPAFPGGVSESGDSGPVAAALREAREETCLDPSGVTPFAVLPRLWIPPTGYAVAPVVAWWKEPGPVCPGDSVEVAAVHRVPIAELLDRDARIRVRHPSGYVGPGFDVRRMVIWGFTGGLLARLLAVGGWAEPWEPTRIVDVDAMGRPVEEPGDHERC